MEKQRVIELSRAVEARLMHLNQQEGVRARLWAILTLSISSAKTLAVWQWSHSQLEVALQHDNLKEAAALLNLQALNCAIEATRRKDQVLAGYAEEVRALSQQAKAWLSSS